MTNARWYSFVGGDVGSWRAADVRAVAGETLAAVARVDVVNTLCLAPDKGWTLRGVTSNERYVAQDEKRQLIDVQPTLDRPLATHAALIPIRKSETWWSLPQDERRRIFEQRSHHIETGLRYLPAIARRLHHCRDIGTSEPFDFLTWFEYAPADEVFFDRLVRELRASEEWSYVEREVDIRLVRE